MGSIRGPILGNIMRWETISQENVFIRENNLFRTEARTVQQGEKVAI